MRGIKEDTMQIRLATLRDLDDLMPLFEEARGTIAALGIDQWQDGYPSRPVIEEDIRLGRSYVVEIDTDIVGTFVLVDDGEVTYNEIFGGRWLTGDARVCHYVAIHRVAVAVARRGSGISTAIMDYATAHARALGRASLRIDTHEGNVVMRRMLEKHGFTLCGEIKLLSGAPRVAYERVLD